MGWQNHAPAGPNGTPGGRWRSLGTRPAPPFWDRNGVYAVFVKTGPLKFRATDLEEALQYGALRNFDWSLEPAIPGPTGSEGGPIASPDPRQIDLLFGPNGGLFLALASLGWRQGNPSPFGEKTLYCKQLRSRIEGWVQPYAS